MSIKELPGGKSPMPSLKDRPLDWMKLNPVPTAIAGLLLVGAMTGGGDNYEQGQYQRQSIQAFNNEAKFSLKQDEQLERYRQEAFDIAVQRQSRCIQLSTDEQAQTHGTIVDGLQVLDPQSRMPLPAGTAVCDSYGWTAVLDNNGRMTNLLQGRISSDIQVQIKEPPKPQPTPTPVLYVPAVQ